MTIVDVFGKNVMRCEKCKHVWMGRGKEIPSQCPRLKCHSKLWNIDPSKKKK